MTADSLDVFRTAVDAYRRESWRALAELCDPESLANFKSALLASFAPPPTHALPLTATELMKAVPGMPRSVAEYQVQRFREGSTPESRLQAALPAIPSIKALEAMKPVEVFAAWLATRSFRADVERAFERKQMTRAMANEVIAAGDGRGDFHVLGVVDDGQDARHVVYRRGETERPETLMLRRQSNDTWLLVADRFLLHGDNDVFAYESDRSDDE